MQEKDSKQLSGEMIQVVSFSLGNEEYGVDIAQVQEINRMVQITHVPRAPHFMEGVINLRGQLIPIIDLRARFGMKRVEHTKNTRIVVTEIGSKRVGMVVDAVSEVLRIPVEQVEEAPEMISGVETEYIRGVGKLSTEGAGTTFTIKLPLTLAIIQALLVRVGGELYSIPLDSVIESQRVEMSEVRTVHGNEVITLRGTVVPLLRIGEFFGLGTARDPEKVMIVIVNMQGRQVGIVVDSFQGEQEIVIKPLSDVIGRISGISGATILGNGSISLIIDVHSLVSEAYASGRVARAEYSAV